MRLVAVSLIASVFCLIILMGRTEPQPPSEIATRAGAKVVYVTPRPQPPELTYEAETACRALQNTLANIERGLRARPSDLEELQARRRADHAKLEILSFGVFPNFDDPSDDDNHNRALARKDRKYAAYWKDRTQAENDAIQRLRNDRNCVTCKSDPATLTRLRRLLQSRCGTSDR